MLLILVIVLVLLCVGGGAWGHGQYGLAGWSPLGLLLLVVVVLFLTGHLH